MKERLKTSMATVGCGLLLCAASIQAVEEESTGMSAVHFTVTDHLIFSNAKDPVFIGPQPVSLFMHEDRPRLEYDNYALGIHFTNQFTTNGSKERNSPFFLEKAYGTAEWTNWDLKLGDSYQELGRGIALSLFDNPAFGQNNTVQGVAARFHPSVFDGTVFGGRVNSITNPVAINPLPDPLLTHNMYLAGGSAKVEVAKQSHLGVQYVASYSQQADTLNIDHSWNTAGVVASKENIVDGLDFYGESNLMKNEVKLPISQRLDDGYGSYGSVIWSPAPWQVRVEGIDYRNFNYPFQRPPTLEDSSVAYITTDNESAGRVYGEYRAPESGASVYSSFLGGWDRDHLAPIYHPILGSKFNGPGRTEYELKAGYRTMAEYAQMWHAGLKWKIHTFKGQAFELNGTSINWQHNLATVQLTKEYRNILSATYTFSERITTTLGYEYVPTNTANLGNHFFNFGGTYKTGALSTKAFLGQTSGGVQCAGGVCREVPPYSGAMVETNYVF